MDVTTAALIGLIALALLSDLLSAEGAIALGTIYGGWRIVRTMGTRITQLHPISGFAAETGAAVASFGSTALGAPRIHHPHRRGRQRRSELGEPRLERKLPIFRRVAVAWLVTMPVAALIAALAYWGATGPPGPYNVILMSVVLAALAWLLVVAVRRAPSAADIEEQAEHEVPLRAGSGTLTGTARVRVTSRKPERTRAVAQEVDEPL